MAKITTTEAMRFEALLNCSAACALYPDMADWFAKKLEQIEKRKENKKPTEVQIKNVETVNAIYAFMGADENRLFAIADLIKECPACAGMSNQKVFSLLKSLIAEGKVERIEDKRKVFFKVIM